MHTGYRPGAGGITYPGLGSTVSAELARPDSPLPNFVVTGEPLNKHDVIRDPGYRGPRHQPLVLTDLSRGLENATATPAPDEFERRTQLLGQLEQNFARTTQSPAALAHSAGLTAALQLMRSDRRECFDLSREPAGSRDRYGDTDFGRGCLLARRLVEANVGFVEVYLANWDSHERKVADRTRELMTHVDMGMSALIEDLRSRGLLESTLIIWMGEFGRTPRMNTTGGRDHFSRAWSTVMFGGGLRGGQVVGKTDATGNEVKERPVSVMDFMATTCHLLGIDYKKEADTPAGRPVRLVDKGERLISELLA
jgi:uncharacterized protein (DUF1501 family)